MRFLLDRFPIQLCTKASLNLTDAGGTTVRVLRGRVWITQEGLPDDLFLDAGQRYTFERDGRAILSAEGARQAATIAFESPLRVATNGGFADRLWRHWFQRREPRVKSQGPVGSLEAI